MLRTSRLLLVAVVIAFIAGCALRPRYRDLLANSPEGDFVQIQLLNRDTNLPVEGAVVSMGEGKDRITSPTDMNGVVRLPRQAKLEDANPMVIVELPAGVTRYALAPAPQNTQMVGPGQPPMNGSDQPGP